jgi:hypothetical protein
MPAGHFIFGATSSFHAAFAAHAQPCQLPAIIRPCAIDSINSPLPPPFDMPEFRSFLHHIFGRHFLHFSFTSSRQISLFSCRHHIITPLFANSFTNVTFFQSVAIFSSASHHHILSSPVREY